MKKINLILFFCITLHFDTISQTNFNGNGQNGFGASIGTATLTAVDNGTNIDFTLTRGAGSFTDYLTFYFDSKTGGFPNTTGFNDQADIFRKAVSGINGNGRSTVNFPVGFEADYALVLHSGYGALWSLANGNNNSLNLVKSMNGPAGNSFYTFSFSLSKSDIGIALPDPIAFNFIGTYGNPNDPAPGYYRSNEGFGSGLPANNPGIGAVNFTGYLSYPLIIAPLNLNTFTGTVKNEIIELKWTTVSEQQLDKFLVQKSGNGLNFTTIAEIEPKNLATGASYLYRDNNLRIGNNFYRIIARNNSGEKAYSKVIRLYYGKIDNNLVLFPNPTRETLNINFMSAVRGNYTLDLFTDGGQQLYSQRFEHNGIDKVIKITLPASMKKGPYRVFIANQYEFYKGTFIVQ